MSVRTTPKPFLSGFAVASVSFFYYHHHDDEVPVPARLDLGFGQSLCSCHVWSLTATKQVRRWPLSRAAFLGWFTVGGAGWWLMAADAETKLESRV